MAATPQAKLKFKGVEITQVNYKVHHFPANKPDDINYSLNIDCKIGEYKSDNKSFLIILSLMLSSEFLELGVKGFGVFEIGGEPNEDEINSFKKTNAPAITFPYFRAFIGTFTSQWGSKFPTVTLPPQFFDIQGMQTIELENYV